MNNEKICSEFIKQLDSVSDKEILFWGNSLFLETFLKEYDLSKYNIIGIIDRNPQKHNIKTEGYTVFPPEILKRYPDAKIIFTIKNNHHYVYNTIKYNYRHLLNIENLMPNIFPNVIDKSTNHVFLINENGEKEEVEYINGLQIFFEGENNCVEIGANPIPLFSDSIIVCGDNSQVKIDSSIKQITNLYARLTTKNAKLTIGKNFGSYKTEIFIINEPNMQVIIGEDCMFANNIHITTSDHHTIYDIKTGEVLNSPKIGIEIGNHVWLCRGVNVLKESKISDNSIVGLGSLINSRFEEENVVIAGIPAKIVKRNVNWDIRDTYRYMEDLNYNYGVENSV